MATPTTAAGKAPAVETKKPVIFIIADDAGKHFRIAARNLQRYAKEIGMGQSAKIEDFEVTPVEVIDLKKLDKEAARKLYFEIADD